VVLRFFALAVVVLALSGCPKPAVAPDEGRLLSDLKTGLAQRDRKLRSYELHGTTTEQGQVAQFRFFYRAPNRMRGVLEKPTEREFAFDGTTLRELDRVGKKLTEISLDVPEERAKLFLTQLFGAFAPEGYRVPLLLSSGVTVRQTKHPRAENALEARQETADDSGQKIAVTYLFRAPAMDLLEKRTEVAGQPGASVVVEDEHCDEKLGLCVPKRLTQGEAVTVFDEVKLNPEIPQDSFTLTAPEGFVTEKRSVGAK
jgi:outer membrane lipoprotein-sorting protein